MTRQLGKMSRFFFALALALALTACGAPKADTTEAGATEAAEAAEAPAEAAEATESAEVAETPAEAEAPAEADETVEAEAPAEAVPTKVLQLGASSFTVAIPDSCQEGELTEEDIADDQVGYYKSDDTTMDFDVYYFSKEGYPDTLAGFVTQEAAEYNASEVVTDAEINGIPAGYYRSVKESDGVEYNVITYTVEDGDNYAQIAFWLDGDNAEAEALAIINTLSMG